MARVSKIVESVYVRVPWFWEGAHALKLGLGLAFVLGSFAKISYFQFLPCNYEGKNS